MGNQPRLERAELEAVLQSGIFNRAPALASFLQYVCERHLGGRADEIKEYSIAIEALGRPADFDQKKDSIVRVEAHKLRKRLAEYYKGPGATHSIRIEIPNGQYAPQFVAAPVDESIAVVEKPSHLLALEFSQPIIEVPPATDVSISASSESKSRRQVWASLALCICTAAGVGLWAWFASHQTQLNSGEVWEGSYSSPVASEFRILAGYHGTPFTDKQGRTWGSDAYYRGGYSYEILRRVPIQAQPDPAFLKSKRQGTFQYDIPLRNGTYELHLYFAETDFGMGNPSGGAESDRLFGITINGTRRIELFDVLAEAGAPNRLQERVFKDVVPASDGRLHLHFGPEVGTAFLNALEILPSLPGRIRPIRIVAQDRSVTDEEGKLWLADEYVIGGHMVLRPDSVTNVKAKPIYQGERYGNFTYHLPLAPGKYRLTLHFAETFFGTKQSNLPGVGSRLFNVFANGTALLRNFDIAKEAGGSNLGIERSFDDLEPNAQGKLILEFVPILNYACVNAIEVTQVK